MHKRNQSLVACRSWSEVFLLCTSNVMRRIWDFYKDFFFILKFFGFVCKIVGLWRIWVFKKNSLEILGMDLFFTIYMMVTFVLNCAQFSIDTYSSKAEKRNYLSCSSWNRTTQEVQGFVLLACRASRWQLSFHTLLTLSSGELWFRKIWVTYCWGNYISWSAKLEITSHSLGKRIPSKEQMINQFTSKSDSPIKTN